MSRNKFSTETRQVGYLFDVVKRPIENSMHCQLMLLRLIFDVVKVFERRRIFTSCGQFASRDLIIGNGAVNQIDTGIKTYASALSLNSQRISDPEAWLELRNQKPWVEIQFGEPRPPDLRQPFLNIRAFEKPEDWGIEKVIDFYPNKEWVSVNQAARFFGMSDSTIRRRVELFQSQYGERLIVVTSGKHRRINLECLRLLLNG
jgi:hypothetical protein